MNRTRTQLGLTQKELAALTGVSRSTISLYEKGLRNLPTSALVKLAQLETLQAQGRQQKTMPGHPAQSRLQTQLLKVEKLLNTHARRAEEDALHISIVLNRMQERYVRLTQKLLLINHLMEEKGSTTQQLLLLQNMEQDVLEAMASCSPAQQLIMEYKLGVLKSRHQVAQQTHSLAQQRIAGDAL